LPIIAWWFALCYLDHRFERYPPDYHFFLSVSIGCALGLALLVSIRGVPGKRPEDRPQAGNPEQSQQQAAKSREDRRSEERSRRDAAAAAADAGEEEPSMPVHNTFSPSIEDRTQSSSSATERNVLLDEVD
jgi:hypothetical protein